MKDVSIFKILCLSVVGPFGVCVSEKQKLWKLCVHKFTRLTRMTELTRDSVRQV